MDENGERAGELNEDRDGGVVMSNLECESVKLELILRKSNLGEGI